MVTAGENTDNTDAYSTMQNKKAIEKCHSIAVYYYRAFKFNPFHMYAENNFCISFQKILSNILMVYLPIIVVRHHKRARTPLICKIRSCIQYNKLTTSLMFSL